MGKSFTRRGRWRRWCAPAAHSFNMLNPTVCCITRAADDAVLADAIARAVHDVDPALVLVGLAGSELIRAGERYHLATRQEVFADRGYRRDGRLVPRGERAH